MSIINEALKKTQTNLDHLRPEAKNIPRVEKNPWLWVALTLISVGFLGCTIAFVFLISSRDQIISTPINEETKNYRFEASKPKALPAPLKPKGVPSAKSAQTGELVLNG
ncbi:MAG: hypothetical protein ACHQVK_05525, partial [Candidatus Paceibacterales bacterium]